MIPDPPPSPASWVVTVAVPILTLLAGIIVARVTARGNQRVTELERELPPYEALALRTSTLEKSIKTLEQENRAERKAYEERTRCLEEAVEELRDTLHQDREWIKRAIAVAEIRGAVDHISPLPDWLDMDSESFWQHRRRLRGADPPADDGQPDDISEP